MPCATGNGRATTLNWKNVENGSWTAEMEHFKKNV